MLEYQSISALCAAAEEAGVSLSELVLRDQAEEMELPAEVLYQRMRENLQVMRQAIQAGSMPETRSLSGLTGGDAFKMKRYAQEGGIIGGFMNRSIARALAVSEYNAAMGKVVELGKDLAMQIAAMNPAFLDKADVSQDTLDKEKEIQLAMMANDPKMAAKPDKVKEGIVMGKLGKYYEENCLMQQAFVKENKVSVEKHVAAVAKEVGGSIQIKGFYRFERGEGLEKKEENFAEEIAKQLGQA